LCIAVTFNEGVRSQLPGELVGTFNVAAQLFRRIGLLIEMTNANEDDFKRISS